MGAKLRATIPLAFATMAPCLTSKVARSFPTFGTSYGTCKFESPLLIHEWSTHWTIWSTQCATHVQEKHAGLSSLQSCKCEHKEQLISHPIKNLKNKATNIIYHSKCKWGTRTCEAVSGQHAHVRAGAKADEADCPPRYVSREIISFPNATEEKKMMEAIIQGALLQTGPGLIGVNVYKWCFLCTDLGIGTPECTDRIIGIRSRMPERRKSIIKTSPPATLLIVLVGILPWQSLHACAQTIRTCMHIL